MIDGRSPERPYDREMEAVRAQGLFFSFLGDVGVPPDHIDDWREMFADFLAYPDHADEHPFDLLERMKTTIRITYRKTEAPAPNLGEANSLVQEYLAVKYFGRKVTPDQTAEEDELRQRLAKFSVALDPAALRDFEKDVADRLLDVIGAEGHRMLDRPKPQP